MIKNKDLETIQADNYLHVHVIPSENTDLLNKVYKRSGLDMETTWRKQLKNQTKYQIVTPSKLLNAIDPLKYKDLLNYLKTRYL
jgi:hypothetical protein